MAITNMNCLSFVSTRDPPWFVRGVSIANNFLLLWCFILFVWPGSVFCTLCCRCFSIVDSRLAFRLFLAIFSLSCLEFSVIYWLLTMFWVKLIHCCGHVKNHICSHVNRYPFDVSLTTINTLIKRLYLYVMGIDFDSFYDFYIWFWIFLDSVLLFVFQVIPCSVFPS